MHKKTLKIALIRKNYTPYGGAEKYLELVSRELHSQGHDIHIFTADPWPDAPFSIHRIGVLRKPSFLSNVLFASRLRKNMLNSRFDCVLSFERTFLQDIYRAGDGCHKEWLKKRGAIESSVKRFSFKLNPHHRILLYLEKKCFENSKIIIANSNMVKQDILHHYPVPEDKIQVIHNGIDLNRYRPAGKEQKEALKRSLGVVDIKDSRIILFAGGDFRRKGLSVLFKAFSLMDRKDLKLIVAGRPVNQRYAEEAKKLGIDKDIIFRGAEKKIEDLYAISDIFVLPTIYDPFSNAVLEAMASGLPVVTTSSNGASELIDNGKQGFVIQDPLDSGMLAEKISAALLNSEDMGRQAHIKASGCSIEKAVDKIINLISAKGG
ncbi:lipopolysaccharide core biosynthesis protein RfaG [bacterium BMS3Abin10]|nr:lipopolysaccharide core biosynthesis protein RfaG [bacterium BMS3Abin10]HDZ62055.1 glycosyltransferase family 1 protein [Nitrospirota bacterium]